MYRIIVVDSTRGNEEGRESEKLMAWYPDSMCENLRVTGLLQGLLHFSSLFDSKSSTADIVDFESTLWVLGALPTPTLYLCIIVEKELLGRHVTDMNLLGVIKNFSDVLCMAPSGDRSDVKVISELVKHYGDKLNDKRSWLRKQLRNPFALTWGAAHTKLPKKLENDFRESYASFSTGVALFKDDICLYSTLDVDSTDKLGSLVLSELQTFVTIASVSTGNLNCVRGFTSLSKSNDLKYLVVTSQGLTLFMIPSDENKFHELHWQAWNSTQIVIDYIDSFKWSDQSERHIPGVRYLSHNVERRMSSPRGKVSSASHHTRAMATTLRDYSSRIEDERLIYTCDKGSDSWAVLSLNSEGLTVSLSLRGLQRTDLVDEFKTSREIHLEITRSI